MQLLEIAANLLQKHLSGAENTSTSSIVNALSDLLPTSGGDIDVSSLLGMFTNNSDGLMALAGSWLGDGDNQSISAAQIMQVFGAGKIGDFASQIGVSNEEAASGLADTVPQLLDKASSGGSLDDNPLGSVVSGLAGKLFS